MDKADGPSRRPRQSLGTPRAPTAVLEPGEEYHDLATLVRGKARKNGEAEALVFGAHRFTYRGLDDRTDRIAAGLHRTGLRAGDRAGAFLFNTPEFVELWFALAKLGAVLVPLNT